MPNDHFDPVECHGCGDLHDPDHKWSTYDPEAGKYCPACTLKEYLTAPVPLDFVALQKELNEYEASRYAK